MPVKGKTLNSSTYKDISEVYLNDGRTVNAIYAPVNGHYELVYNKANKRTKTGALPLTFTDNHANGTILDAFTLYNESENVVGDKTANLAPTFEKWLPNVSVNSTIGGPGQEKVLTFESKVMSSPFIEVEPSTRYYVLNTGVRGDSGMWTNVIWFDENKIVVDYTAQNGNRAVISPSNAKYVRIIVGYVISFGFFKQPSGTPTYVPYGYACPITVTGTTKTIYLPSSITNEVHYTSSKMLSTISLIDGDLHYRESSRSPTWFHVDSSNRSSYYYVANGEVLSESSANDVDKYIIGSKGDTSNILSEGTYTMSVAVKNPPVRGDWFVFFYVGHGDGYYWRGCTVTSSDIVDGIAKASLTFTVDSTEASKVSYALIRFGGINSNVYYANTVVTVSIVEGATPSYPTHELIDSENHVTQISEMPIFPTNNGTNVFDVGTTNKPTKATVSW